MLDPSLCNVTIRLPKVERQALREIAEREDRSISSLVRIGVRAILAEKGEAAPRQRDGLAKADARRRDL
jgi:predicted transcriptional regulator